MRSENVYIPNQSANRAGRPRRVKAASMPPSPPPLQCRRAANIGVAGARGLPVALLSEPHAGQAALPFMSDPSRNHSFPSPRAGINRGSYLIKVGMGEGFKTLRHLGVGEAEAGRECENLGASGGRGEKISARGFNGPVLVGTLLPTAREVRGGVSARAQALNETVRKKSEAYTKCVSASMAEIPRRCVSHGAAPGWPAVAAHGRNPRQSPGSAAPVSLSCPG